MKKRQLIRSIICFTIVCMALTACKKNKNQEVGTNDVTLTPTVTIAPTQSQEDPTLEDTTDDAKTEDDSEQTEDETNTEPDDQYIGESEAVKIIQNEIGEQGYLIELLDDHLNIEENTYYVYQISDGTDIIEPNVLIDKISGELFCYNSEGNKTSFSEYPLYTQSSDSETQDTSNKFTQEDALAQLSKIPAKTLDLPVALSEYTIIYDDWTTNIKNVECYGINAFSEVGDKKKLMGSYYVALDGSVMYKFDSLLDDFAQIEIK